MKNANKALTNMTIGEYLSVMNESLEYSVKDALMQLAEVLERGETQEERIKEDEQLITYLTEVCEGVKDCLGSVLDYTYDYVKLTFEVMENYMQSAIDEAKKHIKKLELENEKLKCELELERLKQEVAERC